MSHDIDRNNRWLARAALIFAGYARLRHRSGARMNYDPQTNDLLLATAECTRARQWGLAIVFGLGAGALLFLVVAIRADALF